MGFLKVIRTWALRDKMPIREIARRTGISRNTIKKYLREGIVEPAFQTPDRPSNLDPYAKQLTAWLVLDQRKSRKERRTAKLMHADLVKLGYDGSYERVAAFVREWKGERQRAYHTTERGTFVPLVFATQARRSSSTGARTGPMSVASGLSCKWRISSSRTAAPFWFGPICCKHMRCCSTLIGMLSVSLKACRAAASTTVRLGRHGSEARPNEDRCRQGQNWQEARCECAVH